MSPFDLEAAKRGEPFFKIDLSGVPLTFLAELKNHGQVAVAYKRFTQNGAEVAAWDYAGNLRMGPRKVTRWVNWYAREDGIPFLGSVAHYTKEEADTSAAAVANRRVACIANEIELPE